MTKLNPIKVGIGTGFLILGVYLIFNNKQDILSVIIGIGAISLGIGLLASSQK